MKLNTVLLCAPHHFKVIYQINPWMDVLNKVDPIKAMEQYETLKQTYKDLGINVLEITQDEDLPDMVYAANCGFPYGKTFIKANFKHDERKQEAEHAKTFFTKLGYTIKELPENVVWEGEGDLIVGGKTYFLGWNKRTDYEAKHYLEEYLGREIVDMKMVSPHFYHLDTCFFPLDEKTVAINPEAFDEDGIYKINQHFENIIEVGEEDNKVMACNAVVFNKTIVTGAGISNKLKKEYARYGYDVIEIQTGEFLKGGGSVKCLTLEFYQ